MNTMKKFERSTWSIDQVTAAVENIKRYMKAAKYTFSAEEGMKRVDTEVFTPTRDLNKTSYGVYPVVAIMNGAGASGKDTFVGALSKCINVLKFSSIDPVKTAAESLIDFSDNSALTLGRNNKSDEYRTFLHDIKMAWVKYHDGPSHYISNTIQDLVTDRVKGGINVDLICLDIREIDEIERVKTYIMNEFGIPCITILIKGLVDPSEYTNDGDRNVEKYNYDFTIINTPGMIEAFNMQAKYFANLLQIANSAFGVPIEN